MFYKSETGEHLPYTTFLSMLLITSLMVITPRPAFAGGTFQRTGSMNVARVGHSFNQCGNLDCDGEPDQQWRSGTLLENGQVLAINRSINAPSELYNLSTGAWSTTGNIGTTVAGFIASRLCNCEVLVTGGLDSGSTSYSTASLYNPSTGHFTVKNGPCGCAAFNGVLLSTGPS